MTIEITLKCDGYGCCESREISQDCDFEVYAVGFHKNFSTGFHYCRKCWPEVEKEIKEEKFIK